MRRVLWLWFTVMVVCLGAFCSFSEAQSTACRGTKVNPMGAGTPRQPITVGVTAVVVASENTSRCALLIFNSSENPMTCMDASKDAGTLTASTGIPISGGTSLNLEFEGQGRWVCMRSGSADAIAVVAEGLP